MLFLMLLCSSTALAAAVLTVRRQLEVRTVTRWGMALAMVLAGISHLFMPTPFVQHLPEWVPARELLVAVTGVLEAVLGAALLLRPPARRMAGIALAGYLVAVFPANVYVAAADIDVDGQPGGPYPWLRLPLQGLFIAWALWSTQKDSSLTAHPAATAAPTTHAPRLGSGRGTAPAASSPEGLDA